MMWWVLLMLGVAVAQHEEEIIVYGDDFARWDETRWLAETELMLPLGLTLAKDRNRSFTSFAMQMRSVLACDKDYESKKARIKKMEVTCEIEDIALVATSLRRWRREADRKVVQDVLDEIDAKLTGVKVQLHVDFKGGVNNVDIEGLSADNQRERTIQETLRQITLRVMAGYHLKIPDHAQRSGQWVEYNSELMEVPSLTSSRGSTTMVHVVSPYKDYQLVQTIGEGTISVAIPAPRNESLRVSGDSGQGSGISAGGVGDLGSRTSGSTPDDGPIDLPGVPNGSGDELSIDMTYSLAATGVALFERETGIMTERVWAVEGTPTASSGGGLTQTIPFRNVGRIRILGKNERPDVGITRQVAAPGAAVEGLDPWRPLNVTPEE